MKKIESAILTAVITAFDIKNFRGTGVTELGKTYVFPLNRRREVHRKKDISSFMDELARYRLEVGEEVVFIPNTNHDGYAFKWAPKWVWEGKGQPKDVKKLVTKKGPKKKPQPPVSPMVQAAKKILTCVYIEFDANDERIYRVWKKISYDRRQQIDLGKLEGLAKRADEKGLLGPDVELEVQDGPRKWVPCTNNPIAHAVNHYSHDNNSAPAEEVVPEEAVPA